MSALRGAEDAVRQWRLGSWDKLGSSKLLVSKDRVRTLSIDTPVSPVSSDIKKTGRIAQRVLPIGGNPMEIRHLTCVNIILHSISFKQAFVLPFGLRGCPLRGTRSMLLGLAYIEGACAGGVGRLGDNLETLQGL